MNIFVGNLSFDSTETDVRNLFEGFGNVASAVIVMSKEKKTPKSRGFGFVEMSDEAQALAAIAALNDKEFMGRLLNVSPARPKVEAQDDMVKLKEERQIKARVHIKEYPRQEIEQEKVWVSKPGTYKGGRRTRSYVNRYGPSAIQEQQVNPRQRNQENPMRWRKRQDQPRPWQKSPGERKPWQKTAEGTQPWKKSEGESRPWRKKTGDSKPWKKSGGGSRPWKRAEGESKPWRKSEGSSKPWKKAEDGSKPWKKTIGEAKPWVQGGERPQGSRFNSSTSSSDKLKAGPERSRRPSLGMVRGDGERSRTKGRRKPGGHKR